MIQSANGVISTSNEDVMHYGWTDSEGNNWNCTVPYHLHRDAEGTWLSCEEASKFAEKGMMGTKVIKARKPEVTATNMPVNLPRPVSNR